jgi:2-polyprenyl-3-methyl-5-hydroxy-6-metoxy-1,4-benzoquinol methylase
MFTTFKPAIRRLFPHYFFPSTPEALKDHRLFQNWWYYSVELLPGMITKGQYADDVPLLPRVLLRNCELDGMNCLDIGSMEGLIPTLMCRQGARTIATDAVDHCSYKMSAVQYYYKVKFDFIALGLMYRVYETLKNTRHKSFDLINVSGLLYHVFSPLMVLSSIRPLLKKNGLMIVSTNVVFDDSYSMYFNNEGRLQTEPNTFWYISVNLLDYILRYLRLAPIDCLYVHHHEMTPPKLGDGSSVKMITDLPSGYISVVCRGTTDALATPDDVWMRTSMAHSWEYNELPHWEFYNQQPTTHIKYNGSNMGQFYRDGLHSLDLFKAVTNGKSFGRATRSIDSQVLTLNDVS